MRDHRLGETSKIITFYTRQFGKLKLVAKGVCSSKSRVGGILERFSWINFVFYEKRSEGMAYLSQADLVEAYTQITADLKRFGYASGATELIDRIIVGEEPHPSIFELLHEMLKLVNHLDTELLAQLFWIFVYRLLSESGYRPHLDGCVSCQQRITEVNRFIRQVEAATFLLFSPEKGGLICRRCAAPEVAYYQISQATIALLRTAAEQPLDFVETQKVSPAQLEEMATLLRGILTYQIGRGDRIMSLEFLEKIK